MNIQTLSKKTHAYALKNAIAHDGKAQVGSVISSLFHEGLKKEDVKKYAKDISKIVGEINKLSVEKQKKEFEKSEDEISERKVREGLEELPSIPKTGVVMRFRPSPSGPLHVGHIISNMISSLYVKKYGGKFYVIIDDTDPQTALKESYENIKKDCDWIFGNVHKYLNASDRMNIYYKYANELIKKKSVYVCTCPSEKFKKFAEFSEECPCRNNDVKENIYRWKKMLSKKGYKEGEAVLRFKSSMSDPNPAMRDFPLARINLTKHPRQGNKYKVWPLMNLAVTADDIELKMTHVIRGKDHRDNAKRQEMIFKTLNKKFPKTFFMGRIKFTDLILSKRKLTEAIRLGKFSGEEDERLPTVASLRKRNYRREAFEKFAIQRGLTEVDRVMSSKDFFELLDTWNRNI